MNKKQLNVSFSNINNNVSVVSNSTELDVFSNSSELLNPIIDTPININQLQQVISYLPDTTFVRLYNNDLFENDSHIMKLCGNWYFWHSVECKLMPWDWEKDTELLLSDYKDNPDELLDFTHKLKNSWFFHVQDDFDMFALEDINNVISGKTPSYITLNDLLSFECSPKELLIKDISSIINEYKNPNDSAVKILELMNTRFKIFDNLI